MSELKVISGKEIREDIDYNTRGIDPENKEWRNYGKELCDTLYYRKSEADKVIADLEESHKKEVGQLLMEIAGLKADYKEACGRLQTANFIKDEQLAATRHHKYTRCLDNAWWCKKLSHVYALSAYTHRGWKIARYYDEKAELYRKWSTRWLKIAEQFKDKEA